MTHPIVAALRSAAAEDRRAACEAAADDPSAVLLVDPLVAALADRDVRVVRAATAALERIGRRHEAVLVALRPALRSEDPRQRFEAAWTWARLEPPPIALLPAVVSALADLAGDARLRAARLLVELARLHGEVAPVVRSLAAADQPTRVRWIGLLVLRELAPESDIARSAHLAASRDPNPGLARLALTGLAGLAPARQIWDRLREVLARHPDPAFRRIAATAVGALGDAPAEVRDALAHAARSDADAGVRAAAERARASVPSDQQVVE
ncbi:MAG TPA: HEAT repeat domain-containing protein [Myxococcota bacterium]|nr:HEAT repeat domain-containing protein [Myxococcota bacterium]